MGGVWLTSTCAGVRRLPRLQSSVMVMVYESPPEAVREEARMMSWQSSGTVSALAKGATCSIISFSRPSASP